MATQANLDYVQKMFVTYLGRASSASAQEYYADLIDANEANGKAVLFDDLYNSSEGQALYASKTSDQVITQVFQNTFGKDPAFAGLTYYVEELAKGTFNILEAAAIIADNADAAGAATLTAKQQAADKITVAMGSDATKVADYAANADEARTSLAKVTDATSAVAYDGAAELAAVSSGNQVGSSFTLTTGTDTFNGTVNNDTFTGSSTTVTTGDVISDSTSTDQDVLNIAVTDDIDGTNVTFIGIETTNIDLAAFSTAGTADTFEVDLGGWTTGTVNLDNVQAGSTLVKADVDEVATGMTIGLSSDFTTLTLTPDNNASVSVNASATSLAITEDGATTDDLTITGAGAVTLTNVDADGDVKVNAGGAIIVTDADPAATLEATTTKGSITITTADTATSMTLTAATNIDYNGGTAAKTLTLSAAGTGASGTTASDIDATAATTLNLSGNGAAVAYDIDGSAAVNTINVSGDQSVQINASAAAIDALTGTGTADVLTVTDTSTAGSTVLVLDTGAGNAILTGADVDSIQVGVDNTNKKVTVASGANVAVAVTQAAGAEISGLTASAATNTLNLDINDNSATVNTISMTSNKLTSFDTVNVSLTDNLTIATALTATGADLNFSGAGALTLTAVTADKIDASAATGIVNATLTGSATVGTLTTSNTANDIVATTGALTSGNYTIKTGGGDDTITLGATSGNATVDGGSGTDTVALNGDYTAETLSLTNIQVLAVENNTEVNSSLLNGKSYVVTDGDASALKLIADEATVDLSNLVMNAGVIAPTVDATTYTAVTGANVTGSSDGDVIEVDGGKASTASGGAGNDTITGGALADTLNGDGGNDSLTGAAGNDTLDGGAGDDVLKGDGGADNITAGEGADAVTGGQGNDTINLTETVASADDVIFEAVATNGVSTITGFAAGTGVDVTSVVKTDTESQSGAAADTALTFATEATALVTGGAAFVLASDTGNKSVIEITTTLDDDVTLSATSTGADLLQALSSDTTAAGSITVGNNSDKGFLLVYQNGNAYLWHYAEGDGNTAAVAGDLNLVGVYNGITAGAFAAGDFLTA